jgi:FKBP-type peptidyl-prolyl cis-trans isomerase FkpA
MKYLLSVLALVVVACTPSAPPAVPVQAQPPSFSITELAVGTGESIVGGKTAVVHYTGWLYDKAAAGNKGSKFDSSRDRGMPLRFTLGASQVIKGWDQGVEGMQVGGRRQLLIPPELGYGAAGSTAGQIPPNATLLFEVELLAIE